jgi:hypothetical protein
MSDSVRVCAIWAMPGRAVSRGVPRLVFSPKHFAAGWGIISTILHKEHKQNCSV